DREHIAVLHRHRRDVVEAVHVGQRLEVGLVLAELLGAAVKQADVRIDSLDDLAIQLQHQTEHAVGGRMLRAEVDRVIGDLALGRARVLFGEEFAGGIGHFFTSSALSGVGAPLASGWALSSPGRMYSAPSQGLRKSKVRKSWAS